MQSRNVVLNELCRALQQSQYNRVVFRLEDVAPSGSERLEGVVTLYGK